MPTHSHPLIAVIIVGYQSIKDLPDCLDSIYASTYEHFQVFFVDNASADGSLEYVIKNYPKATAIDAGGNLGFAAGNTIGIKKALEAGADYCFLLNPDTVISKTCLEELSGASDGNTILQPLILLHENGQATDLVNTWGNPLHYLGFSYAGGNKESRPSGGGTDIALASGAAVLFPRQVFENIGYFDETFFMYHEDVDLSWRARLAGYQIRSLYAAQVWHKYTFSKNSRKFYFAERNRLLFIIKCYQLKTLLLILPIGLLTELFLLLYALTQKAFLAKLHSWGSVLVLLPRILKERKTVQKLRTLSDKQLYGLMSSNLQFSEVSSAPVRLYNILSRGYWALIRHL
ncbi:MAG: glycosyltransferase family 2 protein [bacterium]